MSCAVVRNRALMKSLLIEDFDAHMKTYDFEVIRKLLFEWADSEWLAGALEKVVDGEIRNLNLQFSMVPHRIPDERVSVAEHDLAVASTARTGWRPDLWSRRDCARLLLLLASSTDPEVTFERAEQLFITADVSESITLYRGLAIYPEGERYLERAREGTRTNITGIFNVIAHQNPYPADFFPDDAWNQLVLKNHFMAQPTATMEGIDSRVNADLAVMLVDYARERRAASRPVPIDLWRCVGSKATDEMREDLSLTAESTDALESAAGRRALADAGFGDDPGTTWTELFPAS